MNESVNTIAVGIAAFETLLALEEAEPDDEFDAVCDKFYPRLQNIIAQSDNAPHIPEVPKRAAPKPVNNVKPDLASLAEEKVVQWTRYASLVTVNVVAFILTRHAPSRFTHRDLQLITNAMKIPQKYRTAKGDVFTAVDALAILCNRLAYPCRIPDLCDRWVRDHGAISRVCNDLVHYIYDEWHHLLEPERLQHFTPRQLETFSSALVAAGCPMRDVWAIIDATFDPIARPTDDQRVNYSGYLKGHANKYQGVETPDGHLTLCGGPIEGRRADGALLRFTKLPEAAAEWAHGYGGRQLFIYGDPAYGETDTVVSGLKKVEQLSAEEQGFNTEMSKIRQCVEWSFGKVFNYWSFLNYPDNLKSHLSPVSKYFLVAVLLTNAHTSIYGSQTSQFFNLPPPTLEQYFTKF